MPNNKGFFKKMISKTKLYYLFLLTKKNEL